MDCNKNVENNYKCIISLERLGYLKCYLLLHVQLLFKTFSYPIKGLAGKHLYRSVDLIVLTFLVTM